jgi:hypothetical protein
MIRRLSRVLVLVATVAVLVAGCGANDGPPLTDPKEIVTAALKSSEAAKTVHVDVAVDGTATVSLPGGSGIGAPVVMTGTTASADLDIQGGAAHATVALPTLFGLAGDLIVVDGKAYLKTSQSGDQYVLTDLDGSPIDPTDMSGLIDNLGDVLLQSGVTLAKGDDITCGSRSCYTVNTKLTADQVKVLGGGAAAGLPLDLAGASLDLSVRVEKPLPYHFAGLSGELKTRDGQSLKIDVTFSKWDGSVSISAPASDKVKQGS